MVNLGDQTPIGGIGMADMSLRLFAVGGGRSQSSVRIRRQSCRFSVAAGRAQKRSSATIRTLRPRLHDESLELSGALERNCEASSGGGTPCGQLSLITITKLGVSEVSSVQKVFESVGAEVRIEETREHRTRAEAMMLVVGQPPTFPLALQSQGVALAWALDRWISSLQRARCPSRDPIAVPIPAAGC